MNAFHLLRTLILVAAILTLTSSARATYEEQLQERTKLQADIKAAKAYLQGLQRAQLRHLANPDTVTTAERMMQETQKKISQLERKLQGVQAKIVKSEHARMEERMKETARELAQKASRDAAIAAAQQAAKNAARDIAQNASKDSAKTASKDSNKSSSQDAAKSAAHPPAPVCKPSPGH